jgi:hydrogenase expression/formation protein HypC
MCLAIPGKIVEIEGDRAIVDYGSEKREARIVDGDYSVGDYVIVSAKIVSDRVSEEQVKGWLEMLDAGG